jgi:ATP-dependent RNA helicase HelY
VARIEMPTPYAPNNPGFQRQVAMALSNARLREDGRVGVDLGGRRPGRGEEAMVSAEAAAAHPVATCPDAARHVRALDRAERFTRDIERLERRIRGRTESLARQFDRVLRVLESWDYVDGWALTERGERLRRIYHECDLLVAEAIHAGAFDGLDPPDVAGLASVFTFEARGPETGPAPAPPGGLRPRWQQIEQLSAETRASSPPPGTGRRAATCMRCWPTKRSRAVTSSAT